jgi:radical SAM-linked protein
VTGLARFLTHLERGAILKRALFRAGVEPVHTEGYSPRPRMSLGPPLPVGVASCVELADFTVGDPRPAELLAELMRPGFPPGMAIEDEELDFPECFPPLSEISATTCEFDCSPAPDGIWREIRAAARRFQEAAIFPRTKEKRGKTREIDLKTAVPHFELCRPRVFRLTLFCNHPEGQNAGTRDVLEGIFGLPAETQSLVVVHRTGYDRAGGAPFPLDR